MSTLQISQLIDRPAEGNDPWAYANYDNYLNGWVHAPDAVGTLPTPGTDLGSVAIDDFRHGEITQQLNVGELIDRPVEGNSGPSLDSPPTVAYRADKPGFGGFNDQPMMSGPTNFSPGVVPSQEVGTGKPPGWVVAHFPVAQGVNPTRSSYAWEGVFADGQEYFPAGEVDRNRQPGRQPWWPATLDQPGQDPNSRAMWLGSAIIESAPVMSVAELLGRVTGGSAAGAGWGVQ